MHGSRFIGRTSLTSVLLCVSLAAVLANSLALLSSDSAIASRGDAPYYISIARGLAAGKGYVQAASPWPDAPATGRAPGWPAFLALAAVFFPGAEDTRLLRVTCACLNVGTAILISLLGWLLSRNPKVAIASGIGYAFYPVALALMIGGWSEISYVFLAALGLVLILAGGGFVYPGALVLGLGPLVRPNSVLLPLMIAAGSLPWKRPFNRRFLAVCAVLYWLPSACWIARNHAVSGLFTLSTLEGETFYGANNEVVANTLSEWGYWIFPNRIPGETPKAELARTMKEHELDRYYHNKGMAFVRAYWRELPRLELGKLTRAFVPVPWVPNLGSWAVFSVRALFYASIIWTFPALRETDPAYRAVLTGLFLVLLATVLLYYGTYRFTFCAEVFLVPIVAMGIAERCRSRC